jgi:PadR family transcriptional regulator PadR
MSSVRDMQGQPPLAPHLFQILLSLLERDLHGYAILKDISERTGGEVTLGTSTLYAALQRLVRDGFLEETVEAEPQRAQGPPRRCFRITPSGQSLAREEGLRIQRLSRVVAASGLFDSLSSTVSLEEKP